MPFNPELLSRFHSVLVGEIQRSRPTDVDRSFTVAEIYQDLVPYRTHRNVLGVAMNGDYEDVLLRLLGGEGEYLILESDPARRKIRKELESSNPNTALFREFASADVRLNPAALNDVVPTVTVQDGAKGQGAAGAGDGPTAESHGEKGGDTPDVVPVTHLAPDATTEGEALADQPETPMDDETTARVWAIEPAAQEGGTPAAAPPGPPPPTDSTPAAALDRCRWCSEDLPLRNGLNYCPHCGGDARLSPCSACGEALEPSWRYCVTCGTEVAQA